MEQATNISSRAIVIGIGNSGLKIISKLSSMPEASWLRFLAIDTDRSSLDSCPVENKIPAGFEWTHGQGCGGNVTRGERTFALVRKTIEEFVTDASLLIVTGGLGGGTATGGAPIIASIAKNNKIPTMFVMTTPFSFEGHSKRRNVDNGLKELIPAADVLLTLSNDLLFSSLQSDTPVDEAFAKADIEVAQAILGISEILRCNRLIPADFSDFRSILNKKKSSCSIGVGQASHEDGPQRCHIALERMLKSTLLGSIKEISNADALFLTLTGGPDLKIGEIKKVLESVEHLVKPDAKLVVGANTDPAYQTLVQITAIAVHFDQTDLPPSPHQNNITSNLRTPSQKTSKQSTKSPEEIIQAELPLQEISRGVFSKSAPFLYQGEDLDIPTFQRKFISIDKGGH